MWGVRVEVSYQWMAVSPPGVELGHLTERHYRHRMPCLMPHAPGALGHHSGSNAVLVNASCHSCWVPGVR